MRLHRLLPAAVAAMLLLGCAPDSVAPGGGSPTGHPTDPASPAGDPTSRPTSPPATSPADPGDRYDY